MAAASHERGLLRPNAGLSSHLQSHLGSTPLRGEKYRSDCGVVVADHSQERGHRSGTESQDRCVFAVTSSLKQTPPPISLLSLAHSRQGPTVSGSHDAIGMFKC